MVLFSGKCVRNEASRLCCWCLLKPGTTRLRDLIRQESGVKRGDSLQFSGKLTSSQHQCEDIILLVWYRYLKVLWDRKTYGDFILMLWLGTGTCSRKTIRGRNSAQVWKRLNRLQRHLPDIKAGPPPTCFPQSSLPLSHFLFPLNRDQVCIISMT